MLPLMLAMVILATSCDDIETYSEKKDRERSAISSFIKKHNINVISEKDFKAKGCVTDTLKNEYVLLDKSSVYMQIRRPGCGEKIKNGETTTIICRFTEYNVLGDSIQLSNDTFITSSTPDKMSVTNISGTFTGSFISGVMSSVYGTKSVPGGWLVPLTYIKIGRQSEPDEEIASLRLIVPHTQGQSDASGSVYPCYYEITYERGL